MAGADSEGSLIADRTRNSPSERITLWPPRKVLSRLSVRAGWMAMVCVTGHSPPYEPCDRLAFRPRP
eukprot:10853222-Alexandrium_andersonii.AAC.1